MTEPTITAYRVPIHSITITLDSDIRIDDADTLMTACRAFRGVIDVTPNVSDVEAHIAVERARAELGRRIMDVIYDRTRK